MSKASRLREALPTSAPGRTGDEIAEKAGISRKSLSTVMWPFLKRGEILVTEGKDDAPDRFYLNADYTSRKGGGGPKKKTGRKKAAKKAARNVARTPRAAPSAPAVEANDDTSVYALVLRHVGTTLAALEIAMQGEGWDKAFAAHQEAVQLLGPAQ